MEKITLENDVKVKMSPNVAVRTSNPQKAYEFYTKILGFRHRPENKMHVDLDADPINLFIIGDSEIQGPVMELFVENLEEAKEYLIQNGCKVLRWRGRGQDCYIEDPFGIRFNIWEVKRE